MPFNSYEEVVSNADGSWLCQDNAASGTILANVGSNGILQIATNTSAVSVLSGPKTHLPRALQLDGVNHYAQFDSVTKTFNEYSVAGWVRLDSNSTQWDGVMCRRDTTTNDQLGFFINNTTNRIGFNFGSGLHNIESNITLVVGQWTHLAFTVKAANPNAGIKIYKNGVLTYSDTTVRTAPNMTSSLQIGQDAFSPARRPPISIAEIVEDRDVAWRDSEANYLYNGPSTGKPAHQNYYKLLMSL